MKLCKGKGNPSEWGTRSQTLDTRRKTYPKQQAENEPKLIPKEISANWGATELDFWLGRSIEEIHHAKWHIFHPKKRNDTNGTQSPAFNGHPTPKHKRNSHRKRYSIAI